MGAPPRRAPLADAARRARASWRDHIAIWAARTPGEFAEWAERNGDAARCAAPPLRRSPGVCRRGHSRRPGMQPPGELDVFDDSSFRGPALKKGEVESLDYDIRDSTIFQVRTRRA